MHPKANATKDKRAAQEPERDLTKVVAAKLESLGRTEAEIAELVRTKVRDTLRDAGNIATEAVGVAHSVSTEALKAAREAGGLLITARAAAKGVVLGVADVGGDTAAAAGTVVRAAIDAAMRMGTDVAAVARRAVDGVVEAATEVSGQTADVAKAAAVAAVEAAGGLGDAALAVVKDLMGTITVGLRDIADVVLRKAPAETPAPGTAVPQPSRKTPARRVSKPIASRARKAAAPKADVPPAPARRSRTRKVASSGKGTAASARKPRGARAKPSA
jgi:hypothetical protein